MQIFQGTQTFSKIKTSQQKNGETKRNRMQDGRNYKLKEIFKERSGSQIVIAHAT